MSKNYDIKTETVRTADVMENFLTLVTLGVADCGHYNEVTTVTDKDTGSTVTFDSKSDAMAYVSKNSK